MDGLARAVAPGPTGVAGAPGLAGMHHVRLPVSDVPVSLAWYADVLGMQCTLIEEADEYVSGAVVGHPAGVVIGLHRDAERARALRGFVVLALTVQDLAEWVSYLDERGVRHGEVQDCHLGRAVQLADPDGILVELHSVEQPSADEA